MKQIKFRSRTERVLRTTYIVMYAFRSNTELVPVFQSTGTRVLFGIPAESGQNVPPRGTLPSCLVGGGRWLFRVPIFATNAGLGVGVENMSWLLWRWCTLCR